MGDYLLDIWRSFSSILLGLGVTLRYCFAKTITSQYPDVPPALQPAWRGFHWIELQRCIACEGCARICPVECIHLEKSKTRRLDKTTGAAAGGAMRRYEIDYGKCVFCGLCVEACPTECLHMGDNHDLSCYRRADCVGDFVALARAGRQTPEPIWMSGLKGLSWVRQRRQAWEDRAAPYRESLLKTLEETDVSSADKTPGKAKAGNEG